MSSQSRDNFRTWPVALALMAILAICLLALAVRWELVSPALICRMLPVTMTQRSTTVGTPPAGISAASLATTPLTPTEAARQLFSGEASGEAPSLSQLGSPAKRADTQPIAANRLVLSIPLQMHDTHRSDTPAVTEQPKEYELAPHHRELFDWQQAVLAPGPAISGIWTEPHLLLSRLEQLPLHTEVIAWRSEVQLAIHELMTASSLRSGTANAAIDRLEKLYRETMALESKLPPTMERYRMHSTADTLRRNTAIWRAVQQAAIESREREFAEPNMQDMLRKLDRIKVELDQERDAESWIAFLELARVWQIARSGATSDPSARMSIAMRVLTRQERSTLDDRQQAVFDRPAFRDLLDELRLWAYHPAHYETLLFELQRYEAAGREQEAEHILATTRQLAVSPFATDRRLADVIHTEYRGTGVRLAVSDTLLNRFLPAPTQTQEPVNQLIRGANVRGESQVMTGLSIRLLPDTQRIQVGLEANGELTSSTQASKGPATFYSTGRGRFRASKVLQHDGRKLFVWRSDVTTDVNNHLSNFETDYDSLPLINIFARSLAQQQHDEEAPLAKQEVEAKLRNQLQQRFDDEINTKLITLEKQINDKLLTPLNELGLQPTITSVSTTQTRLIGQYRLAAENQLSSPHTRIWAPSASLLSMQLHQSTINNLINRLGLEGRRMELRQLYEEMAATFNLGNDIVPEDLPDGVVIHFADREPIRVDFHDNTVSLTLHIQELTGGDRHFRNFTVRAHFEPETSDIHARLFRRNYVELIGDRLSFGDQIALRGVFSKAFAKQRPIALIDKRLTDHPAFESLALIQFQVEYGWIALAIGHQHDASFDPVISEVAEKPGKQVR